MSLNNSRKRYFEIDSNTQSNEIFAMLDSVDSDEEEQIEELMNDSDTEFVVEGDMDEGEMSEGQNVLVPEANVHVLEGEIAGPSKGKKQKSFKLN